MQLQIDWGKFPELLSLTELSKMLGKDGNTVRGMIRDGILLDRTHVDTQVISFAN